MTPESVSRLVTITQAVSHRLPQLLPRFHPRSGHVGFAVEKVALGQVFLSISVSPANFYSRLLHAHPSSGAFAIRPTAADIPSGLILTSPRVLKKLL